MNSGHLLYYVLLLTAAWSVAMSLQALRILPRRLLKPLRCSHLTGLAVIDLQLARDPDCFREAVERGVPESLANNIQVLRWNTYMDFIFIPLYSLVFALFALFDKDSLGKWVVVLISLTAFFDALENRQILRSLKDLLKTGKPLGTLPRTFSRPKWAAFGCALVLLACIRWRYETGVFILLPPLMLVSALLALLGLIWPRAMRYTGYPFAAVFLTTIARFWP